MIATYSDSVFINCPFDKLYESLLHCMVFTVYRCGFVPRSALEEDDSSDLRLKKIIRLIDKCQFGIHDISRTQLDEVNGLPRFNMPFELGLFMGAKEWGNRGNQQKNALVLDAEKYRYQKFLSDLNGVDIKSNANDPHQLIRSIRNWLNGASGRSSIPSFQTIVRDYIDFSESRLPLMLKASHTSLSEITFNDFCAFVNAALIARLA